ncbi:porin [Arcticibacter sp.]|uniref:porin n=1 Tax=Arcticibacter sp. TaxID=1872630 RepID=UPI00388ED661
MRLKHTLTFAALLICLFGWTPAQAQDKEKEPKWYDTFNIRGYMQVRYNRLLETNDKLKCEQCDKSWGENGGFLLRRARIVLSGQIGKQVYFYFQPDFASSASSSGLNFGQVRDAYFDIGLDSKNEYRFRVGQSKIPYGFENMQSSSNRLPLDRNDGLNSAFSNERDLGVFFYWAPEDKRKLFASLVKDGLKGSGDYGVFAFGVFNGQGANKPDLNRSLHTVARVSYPFEIGNQVIEPGIQAYTGKFVVPEDEISEGVKFLDGRNYLDQRVAASFVLYPKPFGIQAEFNVGEGPEYNKQTDSIEVQNLKGGYVTFSYMIKKFDQTFIPFTRVQYYDGGKKHELDARSYKVNELEIGMEWQPVKQFEFVAMYTISSRRFEDRILPDNAQHGNLLRLQAQLNF